MIQDEATIRIAEAADHPQVLATYSAWDYPHSVSPDDVIYMLEIGAELIGLVRRTYEHGVTMLRGMYVAPSRQRQGFGLRLLRIFVGELNGEECYCLPLSHAAGFYSKVGFMPMLEQNIPSFLQGRLVEYRARGFSVLAMRRPSKRQGFAHAS